MLASKYVPFVTASVLSNKFFGFTCFKYLPTFDQNGETYKSVRKNSFCFSTFYFFPTFIKIMMENFNETRNIIFPFLSLLFCLFYFVNYLVFYLKPEGDVYIDVVPSEVCRFYKINLRIY